MDAEAKRIKEENKKLPFRERWSNFWLYNKWIVLGVLLVVALIGGTIVNIVTRVPDDMLVSVYTSSYFGEEKTSVLEEYLENKCVDIDGDEMVNVSVGVNTADIISEAIDQMGYGVMTKLISESAAHTVAAFIMDETFKNYYVKNYEYPEDNVIEISGIPELKERLKLRDDEKLYWLLDIWAEEDKPSQFDNGERVNKHFIECVK